MERTLKILELSKNYKVSLDTQKKSYTIETIHCNGDYDVSAVYFINTKEIRYYLGGVSNQYADFAQIPVEELEKLKEYVILVMNF